MEESQKRRERLKAMRMEAAESGSYSEAQSSSMGHSLTNPLIESSHVQVESYVSPRFDYYTDPMAAFSANKKRNNNKNNVGPQVSQQPCFTPPRPMNPRSPTYPPRGNYPIDQRPFQSQGVHHTFSPLASPGQSIPLGMPPGNSPNAWGSSVGPPMNYYPPNPSAGGNFASPGFHQGGRPDFHYGQSRGQPASGYRGSPYQGPGHRGSLYQGPGHRGSPYQDSGRGSPYQGSGHRGSPYQDSGRGRGRGMGNSASPVPFQSDRRGLGSHESSSAESRPNKYYNKLMVEDPWKSLKPVIWKPRHAPSSSLDTPDSHKPWLPKSVSTKKPKLTEAPVKSSPQQSLAEYLAASFNEAAGKDAVNDEFGT